VKAKRNDTFSVHSRGMQINAPECTWVEANDRTARFWPSLFARPHLLRHNRRREHSGNSR